MSNEAQKGCWGKNVQPIEKVFFKKRLRQNFESMPGGKSQWIEKMLPRMAVLLPVSYIRIKGKDVRKITWNPLLVWWIKEVGKSKVEKSLELDKKQNGEAYFYISGFRIVNICSIDWWYEGTKIATRGSSPCALVPAMMPLRV